MHCSDNIFYCSSCAVTSLSRTFDDIHRVPVNVSHANCSRDKCTFRVEFWIDGQSYVRAISDCRVERSNLYVSPYQICTMCQGMFHRCDDLELSGYC